MPSVLDAIAMRNAAQRRRVVEKKQGETFDVPEGAGLLVTGCSGCTINAPGKNSSVTIERCDQGTKINVGSVVASLEVINCTDVQVSVSRCRTITVDLSTNVRVICRCRPSSDHEEAKVHQSEAADEASAVRLFTSCSERVSVSFEGVASPSPADADTATAVPSLTYDVPKDWRYEKGDGPRSVSRITIDRSGDGGVTGECKTLRCDQYGTPLEQAEAAEDGVAWTWAHGRVEVPE